MENTPDCSFHYNFFKKAQLLSCIGQELKSLPDFFFDEEFTSTVKSLDLSFNNLRNLDGLERFALLEELTVDNNEIRHTGTIPFLPKLHTLMINKNCIDILEPFVAVIEQKLPVLTYISLLGNKACPNQLVSIDNDDDDYKRYRLFLIYKLPNLKFIDAAPVTKAEKIEAEQKGEFISAVVRPQNATASDIDIREATSPYHPLPSNLTDGQRSVGTYGTCKYIYYGRHSEGNRFIRNNDL